MKGPRQNAQIKVPRPTRPPSAQRRDQHRRDAPRQLHRQRRRVAEVGVNGVIERRDDVPDADTVDEGAKADVLAPEPEFQQEKQDVRAQVLGTQRDAEQLRQPHVQGADGVVAEVGLLEKRNAKGDDDDARHHAHHPPGSRFVQCGAVHRGFSFSVSFSLLYAYFGRETNYLWKDTTIYGGSALPLYFGTSTI